MNDLFKKFWNWWQCQCCRYVHPMADGWPAFWLLISATAITLYLVVGAQQ